jgi:hypothetical protein
MAEIQENTGQVERRRDIKGNWSMRMMVFTKRVTEV